MRFKAPSDHLQKSGFAGSFHVWGSKLAHKTRVVVVSGTWHPLEWLPSWQGLFPAAIRPGTRSILCQPGLIERSDLVLGFSPFSPWLPAKPGVCPFLRLLPGLNVLFGGPIKTETLIYHLTTHCTSQGEGAELLDRPGARGIFWRQKFLLGA